MDAMHFQPKRKILFNRIKEINLHWNIILRFVGRSDESADFLALESNAYFLVDGVFRTTTFI